MKLKRTACLLLALLMFVSLFGCAKKQTSEQPAQTEEPAKEIEVITADTAKQEAQEQQPAEDGKRYGDVTMGPDSDKKTMVVAQSDSFDTLDPFYATQEHAARLRAMCYDTLWDMEWGSTEEVGCCAKEWTISEDGLTVDVEIYDNIHDSEGNPITAYDFEWACEKAHEAGLSATVDSIVATGDYTMTVTMRDEYYPGQLQQCNVPAVSQKAYEADPERFRADPVVTGQYKCISFTAGSSATFMQTYDYWGDVDRLVNYKKANVDVVRLDVVTEKTQKQNGLQAGDLQIARIDASISEDLANDQSITVLTYPGTTPNFFTFNMYEGSPFADNRALREAIAYGCDYDSMALAATRGTGKYKGTFGYSSLAGYNEEWEKLGYHYDPELAKQKLEEAGYQPGELTIKYATSKNDDTATIFQANMAAIGINVEASVYDAPTFKDMRKKFYTHDWDICLGSTGHKGFMTVTLVALTSPQYKQGDGSSVCYAGVIDEELNQFAKETRRTQDQAMIDELYTRIMDKLWYLPLWEEYAFVGVDSKIEALALNTNTFILPQASTFSSDYDIYYTGK